jgi:hypothetical protein
VIRITPNGIREQTTKWARRFVERQRPVRAISGFLDVAFPLSRIFGADLNEGYPARQWHDIRSEFGPVFTF